MPALLQLSVLAPATWAKDPPPVAATKPAASATAAFPAQLIHWVPGANNPVFTAEGPGHWDVKIRERGWILREGDTWHLWYTGYDGTRAGIKLLGYATSPDGLRWTRSPKNPLVRDHWVEDMMVVKQGETYFMFSEGPANGHSELLTSRNGVDWKWEGPLDIRLSDGSQPAKRPGGTPTVWIENGTWYLFHEWLDQGVWLATTKDPMARVWTNVQDEPVLVPGPAEYDKKLIALDQVIRHGDAYYAFYHASAGGSPATWNTNLARSTDLVHWEKYEHNPIVADNKSSGVVVSDAGGYRLYTMHDLVDVFFPRAR